MIKGKEKKDKKGEKEGKGEKGGKKRDKINKGKN